MNLDDILGRAPKQQAIEDSRNKNLVVAGKNILWANKDNQAFVRKVINESETMVQVAKTLGISNQAAFYAMRKYFNKESQKYRYGQCKTQG